VPLWILDEPTTHLDAQGQQLVGALIGEQLGRGGMVLAAVHQDLSIPPQARRRLELAA
jgi:heme exporter protein A